MKKSGSNKTTSVPIEFKGYFWDCDFSALGLPKYRAFVLGRLLHYGGFEAMKWVRRNYSTREVKDYLTKRGEKELDVRSFEFWTKCLEIDGIWD